MDILFRFAIVIVPLVPIFLLSRLLILMAREFVGLIPAILIGNVISFSAILVLGAVALSVDGAPQWSRSMSLFSVYGLVVLFDLVRAVLRRMEESDVDLLPPLPRSSRGPSRQVPVAKGPSHKPRP